VTTRLARILLSTILGAAVIAACGTVTKIPIAWRDPAYQGGPFQKIFVIAVAANDARRRLFEDELAGVLSEKGTIASASYGALPDSQRLGEEQIRRAIQGGGYDGVIVSRLLGVEEDTKYVPPRTYTVPRTYGAYYGYYGRTWDVVHEPGYYDTQKILRLETNLYDVKSGELVWSGQSETFDPKSADDVIDSVTRVVARHLRHEGLIR